MPKALIIHGSGSNPSECWFSWLKQKLENLGFDVIVPAFPSTPETQTLTNWLQVVDQYELPEDTIIIGHSLGVPFILNLLEKQKFSNVYLVAGFVGLLNNKFDPLIQSFSNKDFNWQTINQNYDKIEVIYSDNDPYVKPQKALELAEKLGIEPTLIKGAGHFNSASNYFEFPELLDLIQNKN